jgi:predicted ATPase with chaperone activity
MTFLSQFILVAAMNPTPQGKMPGESHSSPREIQKYLGRISGPLLDRIDLHIEVPPVKFREISGDRTGEPPRHSGQARWCRQRRDQSGAARPVTPMSADVIKYLQRVNGVFKGY